MDHNNNEECAKGITATSVKLRNIRLGFTITSFYLESAIDSIREMEKKVSAIIDEIENKDNQK